MQALSAAEPVAESADAKCDQAIRSAGFSAGEAAHFHGRRL